MNFLFSIIKRMKNDLDMIESHLEGRYEAAEHLEEFTKSDAAFDLQVDENGFIILKEQDNPDYVIDHIANNMMGATKLEQVERRLDDNLPKVKEGSVMKRKDGRWMGRYYDNGQRRFVYAKTQKEAIQELNKAIVERNKRQDDLVITKKSTLNKWITEWISIYKSDLKKSTLVDYEVNIVGKLRKHPLGKKQVSVITAIDIEKFIKSIDAPAARARTFRQLKSCFLSLYKNRIIKNNPFDFVRNVSEPKAKIYVPERKELQSFFDYLKGASFEIYLFSKFISLTGLRKGEALALTWDDINGGYIKVNKAYEPKAKKVQSTKTKTSNRTIPLFGELEPILNEIKKLSNNKEVFSFIYKASVGAAFKNHKNKFGLNKITIHSLRHYFATECLEAGIDRKVVQIWLGHSNYKTTSDIYSHVNNGFENSQVALLAKYRGSCD